MLNRAAVILRYKEPMLRWINEADPRPPEKPLTLSEVNEEHTVYLIRDEDADSRDTVTRWIKLNHAVLFDQELEGWYTDPTLWPANRSWKVFQEWFEIEYHTVLIDTVDGPLLDDED